MGTNRPCSHRGFLLNQLLLNITILKLINKNIMKRTTFLENQLVLEVKLPNRYNQPKLKAYRKGWMQNEHT